MHDQHLHSRHSFDSQAEPEDNVLRAIEVGLRGLTFTEHFDTHPDEWPTCRYDDARYSDDLAALRAKYGDAIFIGKGIEVCYQPRQMAFVLDFLERHEFDLIILSIHWCGERAAHLREHWPEDDPNRMMSTYLDTVLEAVRFARGLHRGGPRVFDVLGHMDFVKRYIHRFFGVSELPGHEAVTEEILRTCLEADLIPEVNTSTLRSGLGEPMPGGRTIRRYAELGGVCMSLGSDAHKAADIGSHFDAAARLLREGGISSTATFARRQVRRVPIE